MEGIAMHKLIGTIEVGVEGKELKFSLPNPALLKKTDLFISISK